MTVSTCRGRQAEEGGEQEMAISFREAFSETHRTWLRIENRTLLRGVLQADVRHGTV